MISRLRSSISRLFSAAAVRRRHRSRPTGPTLKGCMTNVIIVKPPDPRFKQAVFILKDDYFMNSDVSRRELLLQARDAARDYVLSVAPAPRKRFSPLLAALLAAAVVLAAVYGLKILQVI